jgi:predicted MPP superfamily phosphohydrolase
MFEAGDTRLLVNEPVQLGPFAALYSLDDALAGRPDLSGLPNDPGCEVLLLSHCSGFRDELTPDQGRRIRAMISGHTHGGQVAFGGWAPLRPPASGRYVSGWYSGGGPDLFLSRGLGTSLVPLRIGSVPELAIIDWHVPAQ